MHRFWCPLPAPPLYLHLLRHSLLKNIHLSGATEGVKEPETAGNHIGGGLNWAQLWAHMWLHPSGASAPALLGDFCHAWADISWVYLGSLERKALLPGW